MAILLAVHDWLFRLREGCHLNCPLRLLGRTSGGGFEIVV